MKNTETSKYNDDHDTEYVEKVIKINRVNKVVKGGKRLAFRAFVISGNKNGKVGYGLGKSKEVPIAIRKAVERSKRNATKVNIVSGTLAHSVEGKFGSSRVIINPAKPGTGVIAGGAVRVILEAAGFRNIVAKSFGSRNPFNVANATLNGLMTCLDLEQEEKLRKKKLSVYIHQETNESETNSQLKEVQSQNKSSVNKEAIKNKIKEKKTDKKANSKNNKRQEDLDNNKED